MTDFEAREARAPLLSLQVGVKWFAQGSGGLIDFTATWYGACQMPECRFAPCAFGPQNVSELTGGLVLSVYDAGSSKLTRLSDARKAISDITASRQVDMVASHFALFVAPGLDIIKRLPLVDHFHGPWASKSRYEGQHWSNVLARYGVERLVYRRAERVIVLSRAFAEIAMRDYAVPESKLRVIPGSVDVEQFDVEVSRKEACEVLQWPQDREILLTVRRLAARMGLGNLISAMVRIVQARPDAVLYIAGRGRLEPVLREQISALGLAKRVTLLGFVPDATLRFAYRAANLNIIPTAALEGFGLTAAEALASGTPTMVTPVGALPEVVTGLSPDLVFESGSADHIADGIIAALVGGIQSNAAPLPSLCAFALRFQQSGGIRGGHLPGSSMNKRRVLIVNQTGQMGGSEFGLLDLAQHLGSARCAVLLFSDGPLRRRLEAAGLEVVLLNAPGAVMKVTKQGASMRMLMATPATACLISRLTFASRPYDLLVANSQKAAIATMIVGKVLGKPIVWWLHDILSAEHFGSVQRRLVIELSNLTTKRVIAISRTVRDAYVASGGDPDRVHTVLNGIHRPERLGITRPSGNESTRSRDFQLRGHRLLWQICPWKGQHVLIDALARLPAVNAVFVGEALFGEHEYKAALVQRAQQIGVADRCHWLGNREDVPALMRAVDVVVHASIAPEPFGRVIAEGMITGRPILASRSGSATNCSGTTTRVCLSPIIPRTWRQL